MQVTDFPSQTLEARTQKSKFYKVRRGDCLGKIAHKYGTSVERLMRLNDLTSEKIRPGQVLRCS